MLTVEARAGGSILDKDSIEIFCCSAGKTGFYQELQNKKGEQTIAVSQPGAEIDGIRLVIPSDIKMDKEPRVIITIQQGNVIDIPTDRYFPMNAQVYFDFFGLDSIAGIKYTIRAQPHKPRDT